MDDGLEHPVVIIGGGFAGAYCAQRLERLLGAQAHNVLLLDRNNYLTFSPLLIEAGTGSLEPRHAVVSIRSFLRRARFAMGNVTAIDFANKTVTYQPAEDGQTRTAPYEHLVLAPGSITLLPGVPGLTEFGFEMKSLTDAVALRDRAIWMLEAADGEPDPQMRAGMLHFVVAGGSFTGVEVAGEFDTFLHQASRRYHNIAPGECRITLVERGDRILPALDRDLAEYAAQRLRARKVDLVLNTTIGRVERDHILLHDGRRIDTHTVIWCAGIAPCPLVRTLDLPKDTRGYILCEPDLRVKGTTDVWGIGDCAVNTDPTGQAYPATAQHAIREGIAAADNIAAVLGGRPTRPFVYKSRGSLAPLGCRTAVAKIGPIKLSGLTAWFLWRTVYLLKMPGLARKLRVALDWTLDWFFHRDYVQLGVHPPPAPPGPPPSAQLRHPPIVVMAPPPKFPVPALPPPPPPRPKINLVEAMARAHEEED